MSIIASGSEDFGNVFDDLCLSRKVSKRAEGTQTPPPQLEVSVPGEVPDECVSSLIEMLTPRLRQHYSSKTPSRIWNDDGSELSSLLAEEEEISVDRTRSKTKKLLIKEHSSIEMKEVFEELCLSRKKRSYTMVDETNTNDYSSAMPRVQEQDGEVPDENVSSMIEMLRPSIRQLHKRNGVSANVEKPEKVVESKENVLRAYQSEPTVVAPLSNPNFSTTMSDVSLDSIFTTPSNLTDTIDEGMIKTLLSSQPPLDLPMDKGFVETGSNTESTNRNFKRKNKKKRKRSKVKLIKDSGTDTIYQTEDSTNQTEDIISKDTEELINEIQCKTKTVEIKEQVNVTIELEKKTSKEVQEDNGITVLRNRTDWTDTPFLTQESSETVEESAASVMDSEPTRGCPSALQAILHPGKMPVEKKECENKRPKDFVRNKFFNKPITNPCTVGSPYAIGRLNDKIQDRMFPSHSSLSSRPASTGTSLTSIRSYSCSSCYGEEKLGDCCCNALIADTHTAPGEPKVFWAITKINVYPDDTRTYEVMPLTGKKPAELPEKSDSVFVLIPPKPGQFVPSNFE
ncbi:unnamed protein product [Nezara viridula]|uniref:Uncharacterized protein n=1 Tax=Nezara viridula TaxID=85310 RepID=A0A9P0EGD4_NEZVI|nr:unnamed protein product [Nezara viridula]